jgi:hypothetical protein
MLDLTFGIRLQIATVQAWLIMITLWAIFITTTLKIGIFLPYILRPKEVAGFPYYRRMPLLL